MGDPFKDTAGPSLNILVKLMSVVALVIAPLIALEAPAEETAALVETVADEAPAAAPAADEAAAPVDEAAAPAADEAAAPAADEAAAPAADEAAAPAADEAANSAADEAATE